MLLDQVDLFKAELWVSNKPLIRYWGFLMCGAKMTLK